MKNKNNGAFAVFGNPKAACFFFVFTCLVISCKSVKIQNYFRTYDNESLVYKFQKENSGLTTFYDDTLTCKIVVRHGVLGNRYDENFNIFSFEKTNLPISPIQESPFNEFSYFFDKGNLYVGRYENTSSNPLFFSQFKLLIPNKIKKGESFIFKGSDYKCEFTFIDVENFQWHKLPTLKCLKFSITEVYSKRTYYVWLAKKWGIVKWTKPNGDIGIMYE